MQFFHLFSFVVAASYAAALPQPAGLSEKHSNNVDATLASGLEARSYQPESNSYKESATLVSLNRRGNFWGPSGRNGRSGTPPPPSLKETKKILDDAFKRGDFSSANISSTIYRVGDGMVHLYVDGPKAGVAVGGPARDMLARYIGRVDYVNTSLGKWMEVEKQNIINAIRLAMGEVEFSKIAKDFFITLAALEAEVVENEKNAMMAISNIAKRINTPIRNVETMNALFSLSLNIRMQLVERLRSRLEGYETVKVLYGHLSDTIASIKKVVIDQQGIYDNIIKALEAPSPK